jgi:hypothetical protein
MVDKLLPASYNVYYNERRGRHNGPMPTVHLKSPPSIHMADICASQGDTAGGLLRSGGVITVNSPSNDSIHMCAGFRSPTNGAMVDSILHIITTESGLKLSGARLAPICRDGVDATGEGLANLVDQLI